MNTDRSAVQAKQSALDLELKRYGPSLVAFSGGVDSSYLLYRALLALGSSNVVAITFVSPLIPQEDLLRARAIASDLQARQIEVEFDPFSVTGLAGNPRNRCYLCKKALFQTARLTADQLGLQEILEGSNLDDLETERPGIAALKELKIKSPLKKAGLHKEEIRFLSRQMSLTSADVPSSPCLATRFPYGETLNRENLLRVEKAEHFLRGLGIIGPLRVRSANLSARIEVESSAMAAILENRTAIDSAFKDLGFASSSLDLSGFKSGSMDK